MGGAEDDETMMDGLDNDVELIAFLIGVPAWPSASPYFLLLLSVPI